MTFINNNQIAQTKESQSAISPKMAIELLEEGNKRFVDKRPLERDFNKQQSETGNGQFPFAAVVGCIDSRVPAEIVFDQGIGDIFNVRIAGNFVNTDILGSLEFACKLAGSKAIVVLGHTSGGAVKGACDKAELGNLTSMLGNIKPAVDAITKEMGENTSANAEFVQKVAEKNVALTVENIMEKSQVLREMKENNEIAIVGAMYDVSTGRVDFL